MDDPRDDPPSQGCGVGARASRSTFEPFSHGRRHPAHSAAVQSGNRAIVVFLTLCTAQRKPILANHEAVRAIVDAWQAADHWSVGRYIILPDHIHLFCAPGRPDALPVQKWVAFWKSMASRKWRRPNDQPIWQTDCWDTQLRRGENYDEKWEYVCENSVRHGLVSQAANWPYQGELNILDWHDR